MGHSIGSDIGDFRPILTRGPILVAVFAAVNLLAFLMFAAGPSVPVPVRPAVSYDAAQAAHCSQFVELARAKFGPEWKRRLDPRDTTCAQQIQEAWEREWNPREALPEPVIQPTIVTSAAGPAKIAPRDARPAHDPKSHLFAADAIVTGAGASFASADAADREGTSYRSENGRDSGDAAHEEGAIGTSEQGHDVPWFSPSDYGGNDDQTDTNRAHNNEQLGGLGSAHDNDMEGPSDDSDADENDDGRDRAPSRDSD